MHALLCDLWSNIPPEHRTLERSLPERAWCATGIICSVEKCRNSKGAIAAAPSCFLFAGTAEASTIESCCAQEAECVDGASDSHHTWPVCVQQMQETIQQCRRFEDAQIENAQHSFCQSALHDSQPNNHETDI